MATATGNYPADNSSLANFKSWAQAISNAFSTFGWTQTADSGQVNWSTIAAVPSSTYVYEIWKAADTQASAMPIYIKMEYGFSSTSPGIRVTVGTASSGTGTVTGSVSFNALIVTGSGGGGSAAFANQGSALLPCFFSGDAGEFRMIMWQGSTNQGTTTFFGVERSKDATGAKTAEYFTCMSCNSSNSSGNIRQQTTLASLTVTVAETCIVGLGITNNSNTGAFNGTVAAFPVFPVLGKVGNPMLGVMAACNSDVADGATITVASMYGSIHTYVSCKTAPGTINSGFIQLGNLARNGSQNAMLMRFE